MLPTTPSTDRPGGEPDRAGGTRPVPPLSFADIDAGVVPRLRAVVAAQPAAVAVVDPERSLTFGELAERAGRVAEALAQALAQAPAPAGGPRAGAAAGDATGDPAARPVAVLCGHDGPAVATVLGVVLSGHPLLVMDPQTPVARLRGFVERLGAPVCLADAARLPMAGEVVAGIGRAVLSPAGDAPRGADPLASPMWAEPPDPAGVAVLGFTSGSTGRPKVVALNHRHLIGDAWAASSATGCLGADDVLAHTLPMAFAAGTNITLTGPLAGATTALYDVRAAGIGGLAGWIERVGVTMLAASPAILRAFVAAGPTPAELRRLRSLTLSGEAAYGRDVDAVRRLLPPGCTVYQRLGSTETGLITEYRLGPGVATPAGRLPVGEPIGPTGVELADEAGRPVPAGETGRLVVTRSYLATGYWQDPERTREAFADRPDGRRSFRTNDLGRLDEQGQLCLVGRTDHSVKIRGYLVEPGEVDAALHALPDVVEAVTVGAPRADGTSHRLVAYVVSRAARPGAASVRAALRAVLPGHMVPESIVFCAGLPRTDRGKIDRSALPPPPQPSGGQHPITEWEGVIAQVWARALELDEVARDADFFELGGDSLAAEALMAMVVDELEVPPRGVTPALLVEAPTVAAFAQRLRRRPDRAHQTLTRLQPQGHLPPLFVVAGGGGLGVAFALLARRLGPDQPVYALHAHAMERRGIPDWSVGAISRRHLATIRSIQPRGPYFLAGHSFGGVVAFEMAQQLSRHGHDVGLLAVLDSFPPDPRFLPERGRLSVLGRLKDAGGLAVTGLVPTPGVGHYWRFHRQSHFLAQRFRSGPYPGRSVVLVTDSQERDARSSWTGHLTGSWHTEAVGGDHYSMMREPYVSTVAQILRRELAAARGEPAVVTLPVAPLDVAASARPGPAPGA